MSVGIVTPAGKMAVGKTPCSRGSGDHRGYQLARWLTARHRAVELPT